MRIFEDVYIVGGLGDLGEVFVGIFRRVAGFSWRVFVIFVIF